MSPDARRILAAQAVRAFGYGFAAVLLGASLEARGWSGARVGLLLTGILVGAALASVVVGRRADRIGRRRTYAALFLALSFAGLALGLSGNLAVLLLAALTGSLSVEVVEAGPFTSLEQAMLPAVVEPARRARAFGTYNAVATLAGSLGALAAGGPAVLRRIWPALADQRFLLVLVPAGLVGAIIAARLSDRVEAPARARAPLERSRENVSRLAVLFAVDSFAGGFIVQTYVVYWFRLKFGMSLEALGAMFFGVGLLQAVSYLAAARIGERAGLLRTMVWTHLPSNAILALVPLAPSLPGAIALYLARSLLSQMDVPTRQAYIAAMVDPEERTAAAAYTNTARMLARTAGPALAGLSQRLALGLPFFLAGGIKGAYDLAVWARFRRVRLAEEEGS